VGGIIIGQWEEEAGDHMLVAVVVVVARAAWGEMEEMVGGIGHIEYISRVKGERCRGILLFYYL
jgi:hypothetical protein